MTSKSPPLRLRRIVIRDFRGIDHLELDLPQDDDDRAGALVLAGDNGCGKTSVLEAILLLLGRIDLLPADTASPADLVRQGASTFKIEGTFTQGDTRLEVVQDGDQAGSLEQFLRIGGSETPSFGAAISRPALQDAFVRCGSKSPDPTQYLIEFFSARREPEDLGAPTASAAGRRSTREERRLAELKRRLANVFAQSGREQTFGRIEQFIRPFFGDRWELDVIFRSAEVGSDPVVVVRDGPLPSGQRGVVRTFDAIRELSRTGEAAPRVIPIDRLSSGQMAILAITYPFVFGDRPVDLALLDEPEQHLHSTWQRALLEALRRLSPSTQFIVATHSPHVLDSVASYERSELVRDDALPVLPVPDAAE